MSAAPIDQGSVEMEAEEAFWSVVAKRYPEVTTGDFPPDASIAWSQAVHAAVETWLSINQAKPVLLAEDIEKWFRMIAPPDGAGFVILMVDPESGETLGTYTAQDVYLKDGQVCIEAPDHAYNPHPGEDDPVGEIETRGASYRSGYRAGWDAAKATFGPGQALSRVEVALLGVYETYDEANGGLKSDAADCLWHVGRRLGKDLDINEVRAHPASDALDGLMQGGKDAAELAAHAVELLTWLEPS